MKQILKNPILLFFVLAICIALPLCIFPINLFNGEIVSGDGLQEITEKAPLSLSYFFGLGYNEEDMTFVKDFYLLPAGYLLAAVFIIGIPALVAYRVYLKGDTQKD